MSVLPPVVFLMGPTAAGKTAVAMDLVRHLPADIISVDSAMIYRGMDIGTAKPSAEELAVAPHALIDIFDPSESWSVGEFCRRARAEIAKSHEKQRLPVLTGGTMMYFRALEYGLADLPEKDQPTRARIDEMARTGGWAGVHAKLKRVDPDAAQRIHPNDSQRLQRALEVYLLTGIPLSKLQKQTVGDFPYPLFKYAIIPDQRKTLHKRIEQRFQAMLRQGFVEEVRGLLERGDLHAGLPSIRAVGYRQMWPYVGGDESYENACQNALTATRQLAKRQMTWIRSDPGLVQISGNPRDISAGIMKRLSKNTGNWP